MARNSGQCVRTGLDVFSAVDMQLKKSSLRYFAILSKYGTKKVMNLKSMNFHDFSFFLSFVKYNLF